MSDDQRDLIKEAVERIMEKAESYADGASMLLAEAEKDADLANTLWGNYKHRLCADAIRHYATVQRKKSWSGGGPHVTAKSLVDNGSMLKAFPLIGGKPLGEATRQDLRDSIQHYKALSQDMGQKAAWLQMILKAMPADKTVGEVMTERKLKELQERATGQETKYAA